MRPVSVFSLAILPAASIFLGTVSGLAQDATPAPTATPIPGITPLPALAPLPTPLPPLEPGALASPTPVAGVTPAPTPLPDGTMPWTPPPMPTPVLQDASTLSEQLNVPLPAPGQISEPLKPGTETSDLKNSDDMAMKQKMIMSDFEKQLTTLIAKQRNPNVPNLSLNEAVQIALKQNPTILNAIQQIRLTRGQLIQVVAQVMPQLSISSGYSQQAEALTTNGRGSGSTITIPGTNGSKPTVLTLGGTGDVQNQSWNIQFQGSQTIFDAAAFAGIQAGSTVYDSSFFSLRSTIDQIVSQVIGQFYQVVLNRALIVAQEQNVSLLQQQVKDQQNRYDAGTVPRFNVLQAEVALANAQPPLIQAKNNYRISLYSLVQLLGMDYPQGRPSEVPFNVVGTLGYNPRTINTDESIRVAVARNPALKAQRYSILSNASNVTAQLAGYLPTVRANAGYQYVNDAGSSNLAQTVEGWFFGATGNWNVWDGGATYGLVAQAKAQLMQSKNSYDNGVREVVLSVQQSISNLLQARETIDSQTASVVQATEALRLSRERLDAGAGTQLDVLNAQVQLLQSQTNVLQARYDYIAAMASYDLALSLDTQYVEAFDDPLTRPLNPQALNVSERNRFQKVTKSDTPQKDLPKAFRGQDPIKPILEPASSPTPGKKSRGGLAK